MSTIMLSAIMTVLLPPFQYRYLLFLFIVWLLWLELPVLCWIRVVRADSFVLFLILREMLLVFFPLSMMSAVGSSYMAFIILRYSHFAKCFYHKWVLDFIKYFLHIYSYDWVISVFHFVYLMYHVYWFVNIYHLCIPGKVPLDCGIWSF